MGILLILAATSGCNYTLRAGAGLPPHVRTVAVIPFENETDRFELPQEVFEAILRDVPRSFGVQTAGEPHADAVIRGTVRRYSVDAPSYRSGEQGAQVVERQVTLAVEVQVVDRVNNVILWEDRALQARGEFLEASELEETGREIAVDRLVRAIIDGLQSNW
jgi:outer membrane lipopolysaccharide assembly protein LptE/RlpB